MSEIPSPDDERLVRLALAVRAAIKAAETKKAEKEDRKPAWLAVLDSATVAALITIILGGWVGNRLVATYQDDAKKREQAVVDYQEAQRQRYATIEAAYDLLGDAHYHASAMLSLTTSGFNPDNVHDTYRPALQEQRTKLIGSINEFLRQWEKQKLTTGMRLTSAYGREPNVDKAWQDARNAADAMLSKAEALFFKHLENMSAPIDGDILPEEQQFTAASTTLAQTISAAGRTSSEEK
jgi:cell division protein FtsB